MVDPAHANMALDMPRSSCSPGRHYSVATAADLKPDHARPKCIEQHLGIAWIITQIGDNERTGIVAAIDRRERASPPRASTEPLRELFEFGNQFGGPHGLHPRRENDLIPHITGGIQD